MVTVLRGLSEVAEPGIDRIACVGLTELGVGTGAVRARFRGDDGATGQPLLARGRRLRHAADHHLHRRIDHVCASIAQLAFR
jgi:hypothetical protein